MNPSARDALIDAYYVGLDAANYEGFETIFSSDAEYTRPGHRSLQGGPAIRLFFDTERRSSNTTHVVTERRHDPGGTWCKVAVDGSLPEGPFNGLVIGEFEFDAEDSAITCYRVYRGYCR